MKILLIDVDSSIPNIALMKLSTFYKSNGDSVELKKLNYSYYPSKKKKTIIDGKDYDKVYVSIIFDTNKDVLEIINCNEVYFGGTGHSIKIKLSKEIDDMVEDYSIYPENDCSYGFITRGCIRNCYFCVVPKKEGALYKYREIKDIIKHRKVKFMDNNFLAYPEHEQILQDLIRLNIKCQFNQALDIRLVNEVNAELLSKLNYLGEYSFSFDNAFEKESIIKGLNILKKYIKKDWKIRLFLYVNPNMNKIEDIVMRINFCLDNKVLPYIMRDISCFSDIDKNFFTDISCWCNQPNILKKMSFAQFIIKRTKDKKRIERDLYFMKGGQNERNNNTS